MQILTSRKYDEQRLRLHYLDGLRGITALYVVLVHINRYVGDQLPLFLLLFGKTLRYGRFAVAIFIVLSGYCLMLPVIRSSNNYMSRGFIDYIKRRARRILPPYYAALFLSLLIAVVVLVLNHFSIFKWHESPNYGDFHPFFSYVDVLTHLLLIHNLSRETLGSINSPMWTVATEWQIYFLFPILLIPCWRRFGLISVVIVGFLIGIAPLYLLNGLFTAGSPWFIGLFALGMAAADIGFSQKPKLIAIKNSYPWILLIIVFSPIAFLTEWKKFGLDVWISDGFCGLVTAFLLIYCTKSIMESKKLPIMLQLLEHPLIVGLGSFSYSLYLTHGVVVTLLGHFLLSRELTPVNFTVTFYLIAVPMSLAIAYLFFLVFERPFLSSFRNKT
ncbi:MAG: acyltransferase [Tolypothrix brevis GSE-NOS-MK-07-07A]|jgi:peptidoglycan/LPS O-acetylase OafA/YrhL|nr:acyltransferase [Tolypothrix brevis GSE-NOS-MK-07-07A]